MYKLKIGYGLSELGTVAKTLFSLALILAITLIVLSNFRDELTTNSVEYNAVNDILTEVIGLVGWVGVIVLIIVGALLYGYSKTFGGGRR